jgi:hypothetical protein
LLLAGKEKPKGRLGRARVPPMPHPKLQGYMDATVLTLVDGREQVTTGLQMIAGALKNKGDPQPIQLLALRRYLRIGGRAIRANWSWTEAEARGKAEQEPTKSLYAEADRVIAIFREKNPGYSLALSPVRSLERQIELWNGNATVHQAGVDLARRMVKLLEAASYPDTPTGPLWRSFEIGSTTRKYRPSPRTPLLEPPTMAVGPRSTSSC